MIAGITSSRGYRRSSGHEVINCVKNWTTAPHRWCWVGSQVVTKYWNKIRNVYSTLKNQIPTRLIRRTRKVRKALRYNDILADRYLLNAIIWHVVKFGMSNRSANQSTHLYSHGLVQDCSIPIANELEILQSCAKLSICPHHSDVISTATYHPFNDQRLGQECFGRPQNISASSFDPLST